MGSQLFVINKPLKRCPWCKSLPEIRKDDITVLDEIYIDLCEHFGVGSRGNDSAQELMMAQMVQMLSEMPLNELKALPKDMIKFAKSLIGTGILPSEVEIKLSNI